MAAPTDTCENTEYTQPVEDEADEWMFASIDDYNDLYMYDFQYPTRSMTWVSDDRVCVACLLPERRSEVLEMILPDRLLAQQEDKALLRERDFKVLSGGFHNRHIYDVLHVKGTRKILTTEKGENVMRLWQLGDEEYDVIEKEAEVHNSQPDSGPALMSMVEDTHSALFGTTVKNVQEISLQTLEKQWSVSNIKDGSVLSGLTYLSPHTFAVCERNTGNIRIFDKRQACEKFTMIQGSKDIQMPCVFSASATDESDATFAVLDSGGIITTWDARSIKQAQHNVNIDMKNTRGDTLQIQFSRSSNHTVSVSGFDGNIYIYETEKWPQEAANCPVVKPNFVHKGHEVCLDDDYYGILTVLSHTWHPSQTRLVLSAATDGSLHAWNYGTEPVEKQVTSSDNKDVKDIKDEAEEEAVVRVEET